MVTALGVFDMFSQIQQVKGSNAKKELVSQFKIDELFMKTINFLLNPYVTSGLSEKKISKDVPDINQGQSFSETLDYLKTHNTGSDYDISYVKGSTQNIESKAVSFALDIYTKSFKLGIGASVVNKALGYDFIPQFSVQLAQSLNMELEKVEGKKFTLTQKFDGHRVIAIADTETGAVEYLARSGKTYEGLDHLDEELLNYARAFTVGKWVFDGELIAQNPQNLETKDLFRLTGKILRSDSADKSHIDLQLFDFLSFEEFNTGISRYCYQERYNAIKHMAWGYEERETAQVHRIPQLYVGEDTSMISTWLDKATEWGWEGLMININDAKYETKRIKGLLKVKKFHDADIQVVDIKEGSGLNSGSLGAALVNYKGNTVSVGSGFSQDERDHYWAHPDELIGKFIQVNYFEETSNQNNDNISLRFPTFVAVTDKLVASYEE